MNIFCLFCVMSGLANTLNFNIFKVHYCLCMSSSSMHFNPLIPKSVQHLISVYCETPCEQSSLTPPRRRKRDCRNRVISLKSPQSRFLD